MVAHSVSLRVVRLDLGILWGQRVVVNIVHLSDLSSIHIYFDILNNYSQISEVFKLLRHFEYEIKTPIIK